MPVSGNMPSVNPFNILQTECMFLHDTLELKGTCLINYLFEKKVLTLMQREDIEYISRPSEKIPKLVALLMKRPAMDFEHFMEGLKEDQDHIRVYLQDCLERAAPSEENSNTDVEMAEDPEPMDDYTEKDCGDDTDEDESVGSDTEEDSGQPLKLIKDFKMDPQEQDVTLHVKVMKVDQVEEKSYQKQFMAVVADATSAVDICVRNDKLFDKFKLEGCIILRNVTWNGKVLFTKPSSTATFASEMSENVIAKAFGKGEPVPISEVCTLPDMCWLNLRGKIVKQSPVTKRKLFKKVLSYQQVKLKDDTGSVYVDVWGDIAEQMQLGGVVEVESCKKRQTLSLDDPWITTTTMSSVKHLQPSQLEHILKDGRYQRGTLVGIDVTSYMSCPTPRCFRFQLTDGLCESCQRQIPDQDQVSYGMATIDILTQKRNIHSLTTYWPQLNRLFRLFKKTPPGSDKEKIVKAFNDLGNKTLKYQACGIVSKFKLKTEIQPWVCQVLANV